MTSISSQKSLPRSFISTMDHPFSSSSSIALIIAFLTTFLVMAIHRYNKKTSCNKKSPPGPRRLPIIGNMHQLVTSLPHRTLADLAKKHGPLMYLKLGEIDNVVVSSVQAANEVFRTNDILLANRPITIVTQNLSYNLRDIVLAPYGEYWRQVKKLCVVHLLSTKRTESFGPVREAAVTMLLRSISGSPQPVNLGKMLYSTTTNIISRATFGDSCRRVDRYTALVERITDVIAGFSLADFFPSVGVLHRLSGVRDKAVRLHQEVDEVLEAVIGEYRAAREAGRTGPGDFLGVLMDLQDQDDPEVSLPTESIKAILFDIYTAGIETSATVLEWTMSEIMKHPQVMKRVQAEVRQVFQNKSTFDEPRLRQLKYMEAVLKESLRLHPPAPLLFPREARDNVTINGYEIPLKTRVFINVWAIARDPDIWTNPNKFSPERFLQSSVDYKGRHLELIPFGAGRRICPGISYGMATVELTLANLLYHFDWQLPNNQRPDCLDMSERPGATIGRKHDLCLVATPYCP